MVFYVGFYELVTAVQLYSSLQNICERPQRRQLVPICHRCIGSRRVKHSRTIRGPMELGLFFPKDVVNCLWSEPDMGQTEVSRISVSFSLALQGISNLDLQLLLSSSYANFPLYSRLTKRLRSQGALSEFQLRVTKQGLDPPAKYYL